MFFKLMLDTLKVWAKEYHVDGFRFDLMSFSFKGDWFNKLDWTYQTNNFTAASAQLSLTTADSWQSQLGKWMVTTNGPFSPLPYYLRLTKDGMPNVGTTYGLGDGGPSVIDHRKVADASFLELVRLGPAGLCIWHSHLLGHPLELDARPVHPARLRHRGRPLG